MGAIPKGNEQVLERRSSKWRMRQVTVGEALRNRVGLEDKSEAGRDKHRGLKRKHGRVGVGV